MRATVAIVVVPSAVLALVGGCSGASDAATHRTSGPYSDRIRELESQVVSDFERDVLADGIVTRDEYEEAHALLRRCVDDAGAFLELHRDEYGFYSYQLDSRSEDSFLACEAGTTGVVAGLFHEMTINPDAADFIELVRDCMVAHDAVGRGTTVEQFRSDFFGDSADVAEDPVVAEAFHTCFTDPLGLLVPEVP